MNASLHFKHMAWRPLPHSMNVPVPSDWQDKADDDPIFGIYKRCGCWTDVEREILSATASQCLGCYALDLGCHTGLTSKTINWSTNHFVDCVDPMLGLPEFAVRFMENTGFPVDWMYPVRSDEFFEDCREKYALVCIDGDHDAPAPLNDARNAAAHLAPRGVILLHDGLGRPVRDAVTWLLDNGFKARFYPTVHGVFCCWRGGFVPPPVALANEPIDLAAHMREMAKDFDFRRCE